MGADKGKKTKLSEVADVEEGDELVVSVEKLQEIQDELEKINEEASDKVLEVEQKYNEIRRPVYNKRNAVIQSIPDFWLTAFLSHPVLGDLFTDDDQKIFKHLVSLDVEDFKDVKSGYCITFNFSENPYFEDTKLTKTFSFSDEGTTNISCTTIKWKEGMEIPNGKASEKKGKKRPLTEESFFSWFTDNQQKSLSDAIYDELRLINLKIEKVLLENHIHEEGTKILFAEVIKEDLWPNPLKYFHNEADMEEFDGEEEDDENEEDDGAEQDDDEEEED